MQSKDYMTRNAPAIPEQIKGRLRGTSRLRDTLSDIRKTISPTRYPALLAWLPNVRHKGRGVFSGQFPNHITRLKRDWPLDPTPPEDEIRWATELLKSHTSKICSFVERAGEYERKALVGDYQGCSDFLDSIERDIGISIWSVETRIALLQAAYGLERQKGYVNGIRALRISNAVAVLAFYLSERNEPATNPLQFRRLMVERCEKWEIPQEYTDYLLFRLADVCNFSLETCAGILRFEATSSVVDYYDTYVRLAQKAVLTTGLPDSLLSGLEALADTINDHRICKVLLLNNSGKCRLSLLRRQQHICSDHLIQENFQRAVAAAESSSSADPMDVTIRFVSAQARAELGVEKPEGSGLGNRIEGLCSLLVTKNESTEDPYLETLRLTSAFQLTSFSGQLARFVSDQYSSHPISANVDALDAFLHSPYLDPHDLAWLPAPAIKTYAAALFEAYGLTPALAGELWRAGVQVPGFDQSSAEKAFGLGKDTVLQIRIHRELVCHNYDTALVLGREIDRSQSRYTRRLAARYIAHCLLKLRRLEEAIDFVVDRILSDPSAASMLPIADCAERLDKSARKLLAAKLSTPIILDLYSRHVSDRLDNLRAYAYEDFLIAHDIERPTALSRLAERFDRNLLVYYLQKICIPGIMQVSSAFSGSQELEQERLAICSILRQIDQPNAKEYELEIRQITRTQVIQQGVLHVDKSRIFVDQAAIRRWAERNLKEGFARYRALLEAGVDTGVIAFTDAVEDVLEGGKAAQTLLALPKNEANDLLDDLVSKLFAECMMNPEYGLDCYLSMRIRHGALSGQLRGPLEEQKIITQREGGSQRYKSNDFWLQKLDYLSPTAQQQFDTRLARFSHDYDSAIDKFAGEFIQVHSTEKEGGLFSKTLPALFLGVIATEIKQDTTFDDFISVYFNWFWQRVEIDLKTVRKRIDENLKPGINSLFASLQSDLESLIGDLPTPDLDRAIRVAQTGAQNALNQVNEWFRLRKPESVPSLTLEEIIDIGLQCVKNIHPDFRPHIDQSIPTLPSFVDWTPLSDIFFIVFENIQKHSGIIRPAVEITASESQDQFRIMVSSEVEVSANIDEAQNRVAKIKQAISEGSYQHGVRSEGGTGLMKLRKIIGQNPKKSNHLDFGFTHDNRFFVELELPYLEIPNEDTGR
jgi:hypothetical protein